MPPRPLSTAKSVQARVLAEAIARAKSVDDFKPFRRAFYLAIIMAEPILLECRVQTRIESKRFLTAITTTWPTVAWSTGCLSMGSSRPAGSAIGHRQSAAPSGSTRAAHLLAWAERLISTHGGWTREPCLYLIPDFETKRPKRGRDPLGDLRRRSLSGARLLERDSGTWPAEHHLFGVRKWV